MGSFNINGSTFTNTTSTSGSSPVANAVAAYDGNVTPLHRNRAATAATTFGSAIQAGPTQEEHNVRLVAQRYDSFEQALFPMLLASGVPADAAERIVEEMHTNPQMAPVRDQAERAWRQARITGV